MPNTVDRLLVHIEVPPIVDLLIRIIQLDDLPTGAGVLEVCFPPLYLYPSQNSILQWLSSENLMGKLIDLLSPAHTSDIHTAVADLVKGIISMATPSPVAGLTENHTGSASNRFARELARTKNIETLASYILIDFSPPPNNGDELEDTVLKALPNFESKTSSVVQSISLVIELIRKNNSDYFEPYLFHTLRNRLIQVQQQQMQDDGRDALEKAMKEMVDRMGVVHLGSVLETLIPKLQILQKFLLYPRSVVHTSPLPPLQLS